MTDARHPDRWLMDRRIQRLTADAYRAYSMTLLWSVANRTDGLLTSEDLDLIPHATPKHAPELMKAGLWVADDEGWHVVDFDTTQTTRAELEAAEQSRVQQRRNGAARVRKHRAKQSGEPAPEPAPEPVTNDVTGGVTDDVTRYVTPLLTGKARTGQDRPGQDDLPSHEQPKLASVPDEPQAVLADFPLTEEEQRDIEWGVLCKSHPRTPRPDLCDKCRATA